MQSYDKRYFRRQLHEECWSYSRWLFAVDAGRRLSSAHRWNQASLPVVHGDGRSLEERITGNSGIVDWTGNKVGKFPMGIG